MDLVYTLFMVAVWFLSTFFTISFLLHVIKHRDRLSESREFDFSKQARRVSIVIPAFNEEERLGQTLASLEMLDYPKDLYEVIVVNDGSSDGTARVAAQYADGRHVILIDNQENKGKAASLNDGIERATGEFIACMDADSQPRPDVLKKTLPYFSNKAVGAVTVTVKVQSAKSLLHKLVDLEYIIGLSLFLKVMSLFDCVIVTPGPFSIYRADLLRKLGGFDRQNIVEDMEIAYRIHREGFRIEHSMDTHVSTYIPQTFGALYTQRKRWYSGALLTFWQHKGTLLRHDMGLFRYFIPYQYGLILLGVVLFLYTGFLWFRNAFTQLSYYALTNFNFFSQFKFDFDVLGISIFSFFGVTAILLTVLFVSIGLKVTNHSRKKMAFGVFGYIALYFLYQFFWISSLGLILLRRRPRWR